MTESSGDEAEPGWLEAYRGLSLEQCTQLAREEGRRIRVLAPGTFHTTDWRPERVDVSVDGDGNVTGVGRG
jgi:hypothetical protein